MDREVLIDDLVKMLDSGMLSGVGHVNVSSDVAGGALGEVAKRQVDSFSCPDCSDVPLACSVPTLEKGLDTDI
jgi:hypothetical protein